MTKSITFNEFNFGLDLRKGASTSDANRLRVLKNACVTDGKTVRKRPGTTLVATLEAGTVGLFAGKGRLNTFYSDAGAVTHANPLFSANALTYEAGTPTGPLLEVMYADVFNGFIYAVPRFELGLGHHYLDGSAITLVTDINCPHTAAVTKTASKLWAIGSTGDTVRFCKTNSPRDWTTANDAGFLPVGLQQSGATNATALGFYNNKLVSFFPDSAQIWQVDVDPAKHQFLQTIDTGTVLPYAHANMAGDVFFMSPQGVRTITAQENTTNLIDTDVGSPIDRSLIAGGFIDISKAKSQYYRGGGQYWLYSGNKAMVYTFSRSNKVSAWSLYEYPFPLDYLDELNAELYIRSGDNVYQVSQSVKTDDGVVYPVRIEMAYLDFKAPGILKQVLGMDAVVSGAGRISHRFDARNVDLVTDPSVIVAGDSRPGYMLPVELLATNLAPVIENDDGADFELHQLVYFYEPLGPVS